mmetsp:Transcript_37587/g.96043  ORF Transcript_37587/g.96043 Transcript_37587/m.96043 type:complete len:412 (-) Transcript_37587:114-1349(-)
MAGSPDPNVQRAQKLTEPRAFATPNLHHKGAADVKDLHAVVARVAHVDFAVRTDANPNGAVQFAVGRAVPANLSHEGSILPEDLDAAVAVVRNDKLVVGGEGEAVGAVELPGLAPPPAKVPEKSPLHVKHLDPVHRKVRHKELALAVEGGARRHIELPRILALATGRTCELAALDLEHDHPAHVVVDARDALRPPLAVHRDIPDAAELVLAPPLRPKDPFDVKLAIKARGPPGRHLIVPFLGHEPRPLYSLGKVPFGQLPKVEHPHDALDLPLGAPGQPPVGGDPALDKLEPLGHPGPRHPAAGPEAAPEEPLDDGGRGTLEERLADVAQPPLRAFQAHGNDVGAVALVQQAELEGDAQVLRPDPVRQQPLAEPPHLVHLRQHGELPPVGLSAGLAAAPEVQELEKTAKGG